MSRIRAAAVSLAILLVLSAALWASSPSSALASCAAVGTPSPHVFTGLVVATRSHDRVATVQTDDGQTVEVHGGPDDPGVFTSSDRTFERGGRYEFHPGNGTNPFEDSQCTATRLVSRVPLPPLPEESDSSPTVLVLVAAGLLVGVVTVAVVVRVRAQPSR